MPRYGRKLEPFNPNKQFRPQNSADTGFYTGDVGDDLLFWLKYNQHALTVSNGANSNLVTLSTPDHDFTNGPNIRFPVGAALHKQNVDENLQITGLTDQNIFPTDEKGFLISGWVYLKSYNADGSGSNNGSCIISKNRSEDGGFDVFINNTGNIGIRFYGNGASHYQKFIVAYTSSPVPLNAWFHFVIYVNGATAVTENAGDYEFSSGTFLDGVKIMLNGQDKSLALSYTNTTIPFLDSSSTAMTINVAYGDGEDDGTFPPDGKVFLNGYLAEIIMINGASILNAEDKLSFIYKVAKDGMLGYQSGYIDNPYRVELNDRQINVRSPSLTIPGDHRAKGNHRIFFDDSNGQPDGAVGSINYASRLFVEDTYNAAVFDNKTFFDGNLIFQSTSSTDYYETSRVFRSPALTQSIEPFVESRIYIEDDTSFYATGSTNLPGFDQKLSGKDVVTITLSNNSTTILGHPEYLEVPTYTDSSGGGGTMEQVVSASFMAYFDTSNNTLNPVGKFYITPQAPRVSSWNTAQDFFGEGGSVAFFDYLQRKNFEETAIGFFEKSMFVSASADTLIGSPLGLNKTGNLENEMSSSYNFTLNAYPDTYYKGSGQPSDYYQFPDGERYKQERKSTIKMKDYITEPFLVEKIVYELPDVDVALRSDKQRILFGPTNHLGFHWEYLSSHGGGTAYATANAYFGRGHQLITAFLLRQYSDSVDLDIDITQGLTTSQENTYSEVGEDGVITFTSNINSDTGREILGYGQAYYYHTWDYQYRNYSSFYRYVFSLYRYPSGNTTFFEWGDEGSKWYNNTGYDAIHTMVEDVFPYEVKIPSSTSPGTSGYTFTNEKIKIESTPKVIPKNEFVALNDFKFPVHHPSGSGDTSQNNAFGQEIYKWRGGPSNISKINSERHQGNALAGKFSEETVNFYTDFSYNYNIGNGSVDYTVTDITETASTYLLLPEDELIFGVQSSPTFGHQYTQNQKIRINPGDIKITLYGSYLKDLKPKKSVRNQTIGFGDNMSSVANDIPNNHDQFDLGTIGEYTGLMVDEVYGNVSALTETNSGLSTFHIDSMNRGRIGSVSAGTAGVFGSLTRNIRIDNDQEYEEHSLYFDVKDLWAQKGKGPYVLGTNNVWSVGHQESGLESFINEHWLFEFPFDEYDTSKKLIIPFEISDFGDFFQVFQYDPAGPTDGVDDYLFFDGTGETSYVYLDALISGNRYTDSGDDGTNLFLQTDSDNYRLLVSIGSRSRGRYQVLLYTAASTANRVKDVRGLKYGLSNHKPSSDAAVFRRTSYGQFRDMLEQRKQTTLYTAQGQSGLEIINSSIPVQIECRDISDGIVLDLTDDVSKIKRNNKDFYQKSTKGFFDNEPIYNDPNAITDEDLITIE